MCRIVLAANLVQTFTELSSNNTMMKKYALTSEYWNLVYVIFPVTVSLAPKESLSSRESLPHSLIKSSYPQKNYP